jgi:hypothetical protein
VCAGVISAAIAAALLVGGAGLAGAATPTPAASSTVGYDLFDQSGDMLVYSHVTGRVAAPNLPVLYDTDEQNFELPDVSSFGHSSGDAFYTVYRSGEFDSTPVATLDVHFDVVDPDKDTWTVTDPTTGQSVPGMSVQITTPNAKHGGVIHENQNYTFTDTDTDAPAGD